MNDKAILIYNWRDIKNPDAGGAEVFTHENAKRWVERGHSVTLFTSRFPGCIKKEIIDGVNIIRDGGKYTVYLKAREYYKKFLKGKFDIIIDEINSVPFLTPKFVNNGEKIVALVHQVAINTWFYELPLPAAIFASYFLEDYLLRNYRNINTITVSNSSKQDLIRFGFNKISIVSEGINFKPLDQIPEKEEDPTFIFVGRLKKYKKPNDAIKAFNIVKEKIPSAKLWVVGDGSHRKELEKIACNDVRFFGRVPDNKKLKLMSRAHAILVPGVREGWGLIVTEANACGTPAIAYDIPGLRDSVQNFNNGILVEPKPEKMAEEMINLVSNKKLLEELSIGALEYSRQFSWDKSSKEMLEILFKK